MYESCKVWPRYYIDYNKDIHKYTYNRRTKMIKKVYIIMMLVMFISCEAKEKSEQEEEILPAVLDEGSKASWKLSSLRYDENILDSIYDDVKKEDEELKQLHIELSDTITKKNRLEKEFNNYNNKNLSYYQSANTILNNLENEKLKELLTSILTESETNYSEEVELLKSELDNLNSTNNDLKDYLSVLKVVKTIQYVETYQEKEKPDIKAIVEIKNRLIEIKDKVTQMLK